MGRALVAAALAAVVLQPARSAAAGPEGAIAGRVTLTSSADGSALPDASGVVVYVTGFDAPPPAAPAEMAQKDVAFIPAVLPVTRGQKVVFRNLDPKYHNVFSSSRTRKFDLGIIKAPGAGDVVFEAPGVVDVYCNIHPEMVATVLVLPNRAHAVTDREGRYRIAGVPAGRWKVFAWSRLTEVGSREVTVAAGEEATADWELAQTKTPEPHLDKRGRPYQAERKRY